MEVRIKEVNGYVDAEWTIEDGVMVVSPKEVKFEPKDGDVVWAENGLSIFKKWGDSTLFYSYFTVFDSSKVGDRCFGKFIRKYIRPATEEEKKKLFDKLAEEGYEFDFDKKELVKIKWKPKVGDTYFRPDFNKCRFLCYEGKARYDTMIYIKDHIAKGWVFKTEQECQEFCNRLNEAINSVKP